MAGTERKVGRAATGRQAHNVRGESQPVIRIMMSDQPLTPAEQYGLDLLIDLSRLIVLVGATPASALPSGHDTQPGSPRTSSDVVSVRIAPATAGSNAGGSAVARLENGIDTDDDAVILQRSLLRAVAEVAGGGVEQQASGRDRHGRVPSGDNPLAAAGREREPLVSLAAIALRAAVTRVAGRRPVMCVAPWPAGYRWCAAFSHDLDVVTGWPLFSALRIAELARKHRAAEARSVVRAALRDAVSDPVWAGVTGVLEADRKANVTSTWFVLCGTPTVASFRRGDLSYRPESRAARRIVDAVRQDGHEIGLHGSFATMDHPGTFETQRARLGLITAAPVTGVRQHFLRMRPGATQEEMARAGFTYDATYGFPDRNGFRLGVADVILGWDEHAGRDSGIWEVPLTWMDRAQSKYQGIEDPVRWVEDALALAVICQRVEGAWIGLWHPNLTSSLGYPGAPAAYERLLGAMMAKQPFTASLDTIVAWRRLRRAVRLTGTPGQNLAVSATTNRGFDIGIEDGGGRPVAQLTRGGPGDSTPLVGFAF